MVPPGILSLFHHMIEIEKRNQGGRETLKNNLGSPWIHTPLIPWGMPGPVVIGVVKYWPLHFLTCAYKFVKIDIQLAHSL